MIRAMPSMPFRPIPGLLAGGVGFGPPYMLQTGRRYALATKSSGGKLPASFQGETVQSLQAEVNAAGVAVNIVSVKYSTDGAALFIEEDHCGPSKVVTNPSTSNGITTTYTDMGPATTCAPGISKGTKVAIGVGGLVVLGIAAWMVLT